MKKLALLAAEIILLVLLLQSTFVQYLFADIQAQLQTWLTDIAEHDERVALSALRDKVSPHMQNLSAYQLSYFDELTHSHSRLAHFHQLYCVGDDKNPYLYGATLRYFCSEIDRSNILNME